MTTLSSPTAHFGMRVALLVLQGERLDAISRRLVVGDDGSIAVLNRPRG